jgi:hypothetical protein
MLVGVDNKITWGDDGKPQFLPPGKDSVTIVDIGSDPANPRIVANLPLMNSIFGPPTNLAITPNGQIALVANSMDWVADGGNWKPAPDNKLYVIDLTTNPPTRIDTVAVGGNPPACRSTAPARSRSSPTAPITDQRARDPGSRSSWSTPSSSGSTSCRVHARRQARARGQVPGALLALSRWTVRR